MKLTPEQIERFWSKVNKKSENECWEWLAGSKNKDGYGGFYLKQINNTMNSHKIAFIIEHNFGIDDIPDGIVIRHSCNNPKCVNPNHLKLGTYQNNSQDMIESGNSLHGSKNPKSLLTDKQASKIRKLWESGKYNQYELADMFGVHQSTIWKIINNQSYIDQNYVPKQVKNHCLKVSLEDIETIKKMRLDGNSVSSICLKFNIGYTQYYNIIKGRRKI